MSNSTLVSCTKISPNKSAPRNHKIDTITIHHTAGKASAESLCELFSHTSRQPSANYVIGTDGRIGLCADICRRNGIKQLLWKNDKSLTGNTDKQNITIHRWFQATACPGDYLLSKIGYVADEANKILLSSDKVSYTVASGDSYWKIAYEQYGRNYANEWCRKLQTLNGNMDLKPNMKISIYTKEYVTGQKNPVNSINGTAASAAAAIVMKNIPKTYIYNGLNYELVFEPAYYMNRYDDLKNAFGNDASKLFNHFLKYGMSEGRQAISTFNVSAYKSLYSDLRKAYGNNIIKYYIHYMQYGHKEKRKAV